MFEKLEKSFVLCDANLLKNINEINAENAGKLLTYIAYCENELSYLLSQFKECVEENCKLSLADLENIYQDKILYRVEDISSEMYILQSFLAPLKEKNVQIVAPIIEAIDGVEALLLMVPEELEQTKCVMLALMK